MSRASSLILALVAGGLLAPGHVGAEPVAKDSPTETKRAAPPAGKLSKAEILKVVRKHAKQVQRCYEVATKADPKLAGQLGVEITIGSTGRVARARIRYSTLGRPVVDGCVVHGVRSWVFAKPRGGEVVFVYPFVFQQPGGRVAVAKKLSRKVVAQGMRAVLGEVRKCNKRFKQAGTAKVRLTIGKGGRVTEAKIGAEPFVGTEAGGCIEAAVKTARFPRFTGEPISFTYPFVLR